MTLDRQAIERAWLTAKETFLDAAEAYSSAAAGAGELSVFARPRRAPPAQYWMASASAEDRAPLDLKIVAAHPQMQRAGDALTDLADRLALIKADGITEFLRVFSGKEGVGIVVETHPPELTFVALLDDPARAVDFALSRQHREPVSPWDIACGRRLIRRDEESGQAYQVEPGAVWFVEWLEALNARTTACSEGHPRGFHIVFQAPYELAETVAQAANTAVQEYRAEAQPQSQAQADQWILEFEKEPRTHEERDRMLRALAAELVELVPA